MIDREEVPNINSALDLELRLASVWQKKRKVERAISGYRKILAQKGDYAPAHIQIGNLMLEQGRVSEAVDIFRKALEVCPNVAELHKGLVNAMIARSGLDEAFKYYELTRLDSKNTSLQPEDIICCAVVKDEALRLPFFLSYYRHKGIARFFMVDNGSTDGCTSFLLEQPDVYLWYSRYSFNKANFGAGWFEVLLRRYGMGRWCCIVDADELLYYPGCESSSIIHLCRELDGKKKRAFSAVLLDMYSDQAIKDTHYTSGQNFLEVCPYFDRKFYHTKYLKAGPYRNQTAYFGGVRQRIFGKAGNYYLSKVPLIKYNIDSILAGGQHWTNLPEIEIARESGCLLHFKYFSSFADYVHQQVNCQEHYGGAIQYKEYAKGLARDEDLLFYGEGHSVKFESSQQLVNLGIMKLDEDDEVSKINPIGISFPKIDRLPAHVDRPFWSVMITAFIRTEYLEQCLKSVLDQDLGTKEMQIEVINDGAPQSVQNEIRALVKAVSGSRIHFYHVPDTVGHPDIFNICIQRARGRWVHILHDDDWVEPGFYQKLQEGITKEPHVGAAFCRHVYSDETGHEKQLSWLERETPGIIDDWLERIGVMCRLQPPAIAVKRDVYENLGGYLAEAESAFDWEMWLRIAKSYAFWYDPNPLVHFRQHNTSETSKLLKSGRQISDARKVIQISSCYLPSNIAERLSKRAREHYALYAMDIAERQMGAGDLEATIRNIREGLKCSQSSQVKQRLVSMLVSNGEKSAEMSRNESFGAGGIPIKDNPDGKISLVNQKTFSCHRSGWNYVLNALLPLHNSKGILFDGFIENNFAWRHTHEGVRPASLLEKLKNEGSFGQLATSEEEGIVPYTSPWTGFLHNPQKMPLWFHYQEAPQTIFTKKIWKQSLDHCLGLFTFSEYHAHWLREQTGKPVSTLIHPTETPEKTFDFKKYLANERKKIIQIGWWLRRLNAIYELPIPQDNSLGYEKIRLVPLFFENADEYLKKLMKKEQDANKMILDQLYSQNTREIIHISNAEYDSMLSENIAFVHLYDANANNLVIECIARATPLLINPLPAVIEYLGTDYPFYFTTMLEAAEKALDASLIFDTHEYLKNCEIRNKLHAEHFLDSFKKSNVYRSI